MVGATDPLHQATDALGRAQLDHEVDVAPIDAKVERRGRHDGAQPSGGHRRLDLAALLHRQRAVMQADRQVLVVDAPQRVEGKLGLGARVDEDDRGLVLADDVVDLRHRMAPHMAAPGNAVLRVDEGDDGRRAGLAHHDLDRRLAELQKLGQGRRVGDRRRKPDEPHLRRQGGQPRQAERQMVAALGRGEGMQLVDDHAAQVREEPRRVGIGQQQRQRFRRRHQKIGRPLTLAQAAALRRIAGAALRPHRQHHLGERLFEVAPNVGRQRLQRGDIEGVQLPLAFLVGEVEAGLAPLRELDQRRQETRQGLAAAGRRDQQGAAPLPRQPDQGELMRARRPATAFEPA